MVGQKSKSNETLKKELNKKKKKKCWASHTGSRTRAAWVKTRNPNR